MDGWMAGGIEGERLIRISWKSMLPPPSIHPAAGISWKCWTAAAGIHSESSLPQCATAPSADCAGCRYCESDPSVIRQPLTLQSSEATSRVTSLSFRAAACLSTAHAVSPLAVRSFNRQMRPVPSPELQRVRARCCDANARWPHGAERWQALACLQQLSPRPRKREQQHASTGPPALESTPGPHSPRGQHVRPCRVEGARKHLGRVPFEDGDVSGRDLRHDRCGRCRRGCSSCC